MKQIPIPQPIKVIDDFFESAELWRHFALKQEFAEDTAGTWPGVRSKPINDINENLFHSLANKLISHIHAKQIFLHLKTNFALVDQSYNLGWIHKDEPFYNVAGVIFLNPNPPKNSGISFFTEIKQDDQNYAKLAHDENQEPCDSRLKFIDFKKQQRELFKRNMYVENKFNRCVMFAPHTYHGAEEYFGTTNQDSRLTITFFGTAQ
jgi:hypothetical protein